VKCLVEGRSVLSLPAGNFPRDLILPDDIDPGGNGFGGDNPSSPGLGGLGTIGNNNGGSGGGVGGVGGGGGGRSPNGPFASNGLAGQTAV
jgi:hypothetical protein